MKFRDDGQIEHDIDGEIMELINNGTSGLSKARVQCATASCIADDNADTDTDEVRT